MGAPGPGDPEAGVARAIRIAAVAHEEQRDKQGAAYVLHPLRMLFAVSPPARAAAVLHDVIEDCGYTRERLEAEGVAPVDAEAVELLSRPEGMDYAAFIERLVRAEGPAAEIAREVKRADIRDNLGRFTDELRAERPDLIERYEAALRTLD